MHQSDLYLPVSPVTSRFAPPARLPAPTSTSVWSQSISNSAIPKKRNVERACDSCRRRKTRCDGPKMPDNVCTNCVQNRKICTYVEASKPRGPPKAYITSLEDRMEKMEALLKRLRPETDFSAELGPPVLRGSWKNEPEPSTSSSCGKKASSLPLHHFRPLSILPPVAFSRRNSLTSLSAMSDREGNIPPEDVAEDPLDKIIQKTQRLTLFDKQPQVKANRILDAAVRFHGKSTNFNLVMATREMKTLYLLESAGSGADTLNNDSERVRVTPGPDLHARAMEEGKRRQEYWRSPDWELVYEGEFLSSETFSELLQNWPPSDLVTALIDLYFLHCNSMFPLLHRPTFARHFADGLYEHNIWFACLCMSVFALASRYTNDSRVLLETVESPVGEPSEQSWWQAAGFKYYFSILEVENKKRATLNPASLFEIQTICLMTQFQSETRWHRGTWYAIGAGIRKMQDIGAHSKQSYGQVGPTVENELWKRVWWYLIGMDRMQCAILGRSCAAKEEDFTAEYPLEVDDNFWENDDPELAFRQPPDTPSTVTAFKLWLQLTDFTASALHCFDIVEHDGPLSGLRTEDVLNQLNENLTEWAEKVPQYLKWSPDIEDVVLANQSATLYTTYNLITMLIQRAFLPSSLALLCSSNNVQPIPPVLAQAMTARAISINAAKAVARILAVVHKRALSNVPLLLTGAEITIAVLCVDWWIIKARDDKFSSSTMRTMESHIQDIKSLLTALRWAAPRWETAQERLAYIEKMVPDQDKESADLGHASTFNFTRERQQDRLSSLRPQHSIAAPSRPDFSCSASHVSASTSPETMAMPTRHTHGRGEEPWPGDLSRQYIPPQHSSAHSTPRISSYSVLPRIRASNSTDYSQRPLDEWAIPQKSYQTSLPPTSGHPHAAPLEPDNPPEFSSIKHEPDADLTAPSPRLGWTYMSHQAPPVPAWEASDVRGGQYDASAVRDGPGSSLLSHLH